jgi:hypothetical protein
MRCEDADLLIESIAADDEPVREELSRHIETCARCASALERARQIDRWLAAAPSVVPPAGFARKVVGRLHAERWRFERKLDLGFNLAIAVGLLVVTAGVWMLLNISGLTAVVEDVTRIYVDSMGTLATRVTIALPTYFAAFALVMTALGVWWWAENRFLVR